MRGAECCFSLLSFPPRGVLRFLLFHLRLSRLIPGKARWVSKKKKGDFCSCSFRVTSYNLRSCQEKIILETRTFEKHYSFSFFWNRFYGKVSSVCSQNSTTDKNAKTFQDSRHKKKLQRKHIFAPLSQVSQGRGCLCNANKAQKRSGIVSEISAIIFPHRYSA